MKLGIIEIATSTMVCGQNVLVKALPHKHTWKKKKRLSAVKKKKSTDFCLFCLAYQGVVVTVCSLSNSIDMPKALYNLILKSCPGNL